MSKTLSKLTAIDQDIALPGEIKTRGIAFAFCVRFAVAEILAVFQV
jgi:hypothetical protein